MLKYRFKSLKYLDSKMINDQRLIKQIYKFPYKIKHKDFGEVKKLELIYRASRDGFHSMNFHSKCDY